MQVPQTIVAKDKSPELVKLFNEAVVVLSRLGIPTEGMTSRQLERMAMSFLAVADVKESKDWARARVREGRDTLKSRDIILYINSNFGETISPGSYDDIRRKDLKMPVVANIVVASANKLKAARNDPTRGFSLSPEYIEVIRRFGTEAWEAEIEKFRVGIVTLTEKLSTVRKLHRVPVRLPDGAVLFFGPGEHNELQKKVVEEFLPRYGYGAEVLYIGDAAQRQLLCDKKRLNSLKFMELEHGELPDVVAYSATKNWLFLIEAVHSYGPISQLRLLQLKRLSSGCLADIVYVTAFLDRETFRKFASEIAWESEVLIATDPDHIVHFDGEKFLGPYESLE